MKVQNKILALMAVGMLLVSAQAAQAKESDDETKSGLGPKSAGQYNCDDINRAIKQRKADFVPQGGNSDGAPSKEKDAI